MTIKIAYHKLFSIEHSLQCHFFQRETPLERKLENPSVIGRTRQAHYFFLIVCIFYSF